MKLPFIVRPLFVMVLFAVAVSTHAQQCPGYNPTMYQSPSSSPTTPTKEQLVSGQTIVKAGAYFYEQFAVDRVRNARVTGSFNASGGTSNDIEVLLLEESSFENWKNGHSAPALYSSGHITSGKIDVLLGQTGTYYIVFNNVFSQSEKQVFSDISLTYLPERSGPDT